MALTFLKVYDCTIFVNCYMDWTVLGLWIWIRTRIWHTLTFFNYLFFWWCFYTFISVVWLEMAGTDKTSKMECFDFFCRVLHLECLICSSYATAYLTTFGHAVFSGATITGISEVDSFSITLYGFQPFIAFGKGLFCSRYVTSNYFRIIIIVIIIIIIIVILIIVSIFC